MQSQPAPTPPPPPAITPTPELVQLPGGSQILVGGTTASPNEVYEAFKAQRNELNRQLSTLEEKRRSIASRLREGEVSGADKLGLETRLTELDGQISEMYKKVNAANDNVSRAAAQPGAVIPDAPFRDGPPQEVLVMGFILAMTFAVPLSIAFARRIWRRSHAPAVSASATISPEMDERLSRLEQAMDAVAVEVERIGEGQRFVTRVLGSGAAEPLALREREGVRAQR